MSISRSFLVGANHSRRSVPTSSSSLFRVDAGADRLSGNGSVAGESDLDFRRMPSSLPNTITGIPIPRNLSRLPHLNWPPADSVFSRRRLTDPRQAMLFPDIPAEEPE